MVTILGRRNIIGKRLAQRTHCRQKVAFLCLSRIKSELGNVLQKANCLEQPCQWSATHVGRRANSLETSATDYRPAFPDPPMAPMHLWLFCPAIDTFRSPNDNLWWKTSRILPFTIQPFSSLTNQGTSTTNDHLCLSTAAHSVTPRCTPPFPGDSLRLLSALPQCR